MGTEPKPSTETLVIGNGFMELACRVIAAMADREGVGMVMVGGDLQLRLLLPGNPAYDKAVAQPDFACSVSASSQHERIAARIRAAFERVSGG